MTTPPATAGTNSTDSRDKPRGRGILLLVLVLALAVAAVPTVIAVMRDDPGRLTTTTGDVRGTVHDSFREFQGIPYAAPPVGDLRWELPRPVASWDGERDGTEPGARCLQLDDEQQQLHPKTSEDCLFLDVSTPRQVQRPVPVMVWFHGGAFSSGAGSDYDPRRLVIRGDVAVVTVNSRLGALGYFGHPDLTDSGTYGLGDQQAALRWVRDNAAAFGGDPGRVTVFGNSSGAANICGHLASPDSANLFHRAIVQSGSCRQQWLPGVMFPGSVELTYWSSSDQVRKDGQAAAATLGCSGADALNCLRAKHPAELLALNGQFLTMAHGTPLLPADPRQRIRSGDINRVPVLQGNTRDEHRLFTQFFEIDESDGPQQYRTLLRASFGNRAGDIARKYPLGTGEHRAQLAWARVGTDSGWVCPTQQVSRELSRHVPTFSYEFADPHPPADPSVTSGFPTGAQHGSEVAYLLDLGGMDLIRGEAQRRLSNRMIDYWTSFARDGRPASADSWPSLSAADRSTLQLRPDGDRVVRADVQHHCKFWGTRR